MKYFFFILVLILSYSFREKEESCALHSHTPIEFSEKEYPKNYYFRLNFHKNQNSGNQRVETNANKLEKGDLIILSQNKKTENNRYLTHIIETVNDADEDKQQ